MEKEKNERKQLPITCRIIQWSNSERNGKQRWWLISLRKSHDETLTDKEVPLRDGFLMGSISREGAGEIMGTTTKDLEYSTYWVD